MKKLLLLLSAAGLIFTACQSGGDVEEDNGSTPFVPEITISPKDLTFGCNGGEQAVDITANFEYEVAERASWLTVEQTDEGLLVVVDANKNTSERSAFISITNSQYDINKTVEVWQEGFVPKIELAQQSIEVEFEPAEYEVAVTSPYSWEATTKNDWIVIESETGIAGDEKLKFTTLRNEEEKVRKGTITVYNSTYNLSAELYVTQKAFVPAITIEPETLTFAFEGSTQEIAITANFEEYEASANADWLTIKKSEKGISVTAQNNVEVDKRTAEITISNEKYGVSKVISVAQGAFVPEITFSPKSLTFDYKGGTKEVAITASFEYEYSTNVDWLTITKSEKGVNITATPNPKFEECTAEITISNKKYGISKTISVVQNGLSAEAQNVILYTSSDGKIVKPYRSWFGGASIVSNTYRDGQGLIIFDAPVTSIGEETFRNCTSLTGITIPNSVTSIRYYAFEECTSLTSVTIPDSVTSIELAVFRRCTSLTSITIGNSVTSIGYYVFGGCTSLTSVTIPNSVTLIDEGAFYDCTSLTSVTIGNSVTSIGGMAFYECSSLTSVTIPDSVTSIGKEAFSGCTSLKSVTIGNGVTSIGVSAFNGCTSLTSVTIGDSVAKIGENAFYGCTGELTVNCNIPSASSEEYGAFYGSKFTKVTIGNSVTSIGERAFLGYTSLTSVTIGNGVTSIGELAFRNCTSLKRVDISDLSAWCKISFGDIDANPLFNGAKLYLNGSELTDIAIPSDITEIKAYAFFGYTSLKSVTIPDSVMSIGSSAFSYCTLLKSVTIPDSVTSIGDYAFRSCTSLFNITIPNSVTSIGDYAFCDCSSLASVYCKPTTPPTTSADYYLGKWKTFYNNASSRKIYVPRNSVSAYKAAEYWKDYASSIVGYDF